MRNSLFWAAIPLLLAGCQTGSPFRDPTARTNEDMAHVVYAYQALGAKPVHALSVQQARMQPTMEDAVRAVTRAVGGPPTPYVRTTDLQVAGAAGPLAARLYDATPGQPQQPVILYFHGGGWSTGSIAADDASARALAVQTRAMVLSVAYRLAPEAKFPAAQDDAFAAYRWLLANAYTLGADPRRIAVAGESAGGALAIGTAVAARDYRVAPPVHVLAISPIVAPVGRTRSYIADQKAVPLGRKDVQWDLGNLIRSPADLADPRLDLLGRADLRGLPPTTIIVAEMDPLESDDIALTSKLQESGVNVTEMEFQGTTHGFFGAGAVVARARQAEIYAALQLSDAFEAIGEPRSSARRRLRIPAARG